MDSNRGLLMLETTALPTKPQQLPFLSFFKKEPATLVLFFIYFYLFKQTLKFWQQIYVKNIHPVNGAWIEPTTFQSTSLLHNLLDQGSHATT